MIGYQKEKQKSLGKYLYQKADGRKLLVLLFLSTVIINGPSA